MIYITRYPFHGLHYMAYITWLTLHDLHYIATLHVLHYMIYITWFTLHYLHYIKSHCTRPDMTDVQTKYCLTQRPNKASEALGSSAQCNSPQNDTSSHRSVYSQRPRGTRDRVPNPSVPLPTASYRVAVGLWIFIVCRHSTDQFCSLIVLESRKMHVFRRH